jgi:hypothetical protein
MHWSNTDRSETFSVVIIVPVFTNTNTLSRQEQVKIGHRPKRDADEPHDSS